MTVATKIVMAHLLSLIIQRATHIAVGDYTDSAPYTAARIVFQLGALRSRSDS